MKTRREVALDSGNSDDDEGVVVVVVHVARLSPLHITSRTESCEFLGHPCIHDPHTIHEYTGRDSREQDEGKRVGNDSGEKTDTVNEGERGERERKRVGGTGE